MQPQYYPIPSNVHMPREDQAQRKRPKYTRSKTGCLTCRVKKIKVLSITRSKVPPYKLYPSATRQNRLVIVVCTAKEMYVGIFNSTIELR
jgi:hypothetical protein